MMPIIMHPVLRSSQCSAYSSLAGATDSTRIYAGKENIDPCYHNDSRAIPTKALTPSPGKALGGQMIAVPFLPTQRNHGGLRFADIMMGQKFNLLYADSEAFDGYCPSSLDFRILWPGYDHLDYNVRLRTKTHGHPTTRWELAREILHAYDCFVERARHASYSLARFDPSWRITSSFSLDDLTLVALTNHDGHPSVFQARVDMVRRR